MNALTRWIFAGSGVSTDIWTSYAARIMILSIIPLIIVQLPQVFQETSLSHLAVLVSLVVSISLLIAYSLYQVYLKVDLINDWCNTNILFEDLPLKPWMQIFQPWIQKRRLAYAKHKHVISGILRNLKMRALGRLFKDDGEPNTDVIETLVFVKLSAFFESILPITHSANCYCSTMAGCLRQLIRIQMGTYLKQS